VASVDGFRDQAASCLDQAKRAVDLTSKLELLGIAVAWLDLADLVERSAARSAVPVEQQAGIQLDRSQLRAD
jgi:hypothetical protein